MAQPLLDELHALELLQDDLLQRPVRHQREPVPVLRAAVRQRRLRRGDREDPPGDGALQAPRPHLGAAQGVQQGGRGLERALVERELAEQVAQRSFPGSVIFPVTP